MANLSVDLKGMRRTAAEVTAMLRTLGNEDRLMLLCQLGQGECNVGELEEALDIRQPTLSQQLSVLRSQGLVSTRREGKQIFYSVSDERALALLKTLYKLYCGGGK